MGYPIDRLLEEVAFIAYHLHWPREEILNMEHGERRQWVSEVSSLNHRMNEA